jgi:hypothetical protein
VPNSEEAIADSRDVPEQTGRAKISTITIVTAKISTITIVTGALAFATVLPWVLEFIIT